MMVWELVVHVPGGGHSLVRTSGPNAALIAVAAGANGGPSGAVEVLSPGFLTVTGGGAQRCVRIVLVVGICLN